MEVKRLEVDAPPCGRLVSPDPTSVWPRISLIQDIWISPNDQILFVGGFHGFESVLHSLDLYESEKDVGLLAKIAFTPDAARQRVEASGPMLELSIGIGWCRE